MIRARNRRLKVEQYMLRGESNSVQIAVGVGATVATICKDKNIIQDWWAEDDPKESERKRNLRVAQHRRVLQLAANAYELSSKKEVKDKDGMPTGEVIQIPGNPKYLTIIQTAIKEMAKLEGLEVIKVESKHRHVHSHLLVEMADLKGVDDDELLRVKVAILKLLPGPNGSGQVVEGAIVEKDEEG